MDADVYEIDCLVAGAGAVGLACAAELARRGREVLVAEAAPCIGAGISSRNSEVIHAGPYYPTGSLKHLLCVRGRRMLYDYLARHGVGHRKCGKLIVAANAEEEAKIAAIHALGLANEVENMRLISAAEARALEPNLACAAALVSEETGILDSHGYMLALQHEIEALGGIVAVNAPIEAGEPRAGGGVELALGGPMPARVRCRSFINAAGLGAQALARAIATPAAQIPDLVLAKGSYFGCAGRPAFSRLIYPAPIEGGLGVHLTLDLAGRMRFGPDVEWLDETDPARVSYDVDAARAESFYAVIRRYWPRLPDGALTPDYAGCRPKLSRRGAPAADFRIDGPEAHGLGGLVNMFGIESPGLTASLAIAAVAADRLDE